MATGLNKGSEFETSKIIIDTATKALQAQQTFQPIISMPLMPNTPAWTTTVTNIPHTVGQTLTEADSIARAELEQCKPEVGYITAYRSYSIQGEGMLQGYNSALHKPQDPQPAMHEGSHLVMPTNWNMGGGDPELTVGGLFTECHCGMCGYYSLKEKPTNIDLIAKVAVWGKVVEHEMGYRSEYLYPLEFFFEPICNAGCGNLAVIWQGGNDGYLYLCQSCKDGTRIDDMLDNLKAQYLYPPDEVEVNDVSDR